ncbi:acylneuraminate cytidylyltransferase family protein [Lactococcus formosensis]|uniref:acylneuraminate cytidylyltransferase family protein n=1 Tax=Lactococcus formosensis TaxID=1281486 RepID=UPI0024347F4C|nr:acylneuraminate cytidylyltransferase family protein [Lactococcus formosensis]MDG6126096.1 acylneuraminate cytidylyltransferase family protein [Lactococcus formosensis]MDG6187899.1 acylneuraminate cytidylyltransferase family protein [Lactococcus formosensis]
MKNIAIITARSGSKGLPNKNILDLGGKPLIAYTIEAAIKSSMFDKVFVSTDSEEYAKLSENYGATAYPLRPASLAGDKIGSIDVLLNVLENNQGFDTFCLLQPTSPFRTSEDIRSGYNLFINKNAKSVVSLSESDKSPRIINKINEDGTIFDFLKLDENSYARQNEKYYIPNGAIFISDIAEFKSSKSFYGKKSYPYIMSKEQSIDIDDRYDFELAKIILKEKRILEQ